jgi:hypothetical protein
MLTLPKSDAALAGYRQLFAGADALSDIWHLRLLAVLRSHVPRRRKDCGDRDEPILPWGQGLRPFAGAAHPEVRMGSGGVKTIYLCDSRRLFPWLSVTHGAVPFMGNVHAKEQGHSGTYFLLSLCQDFGEYDISSNDSAHERAALVVAWGVEPTPFTSHQGRPAMALPNQATA